jgi:hypothetical protein
VQLRSHPPDDFEGVLAVPHDDDAADVVPEPVQIGDAAADLGSKLDAGDVAQQDRRAGRVDADDDDSKSCSVLA